MNFSLPLVVHSIALIKTEYSDIHIICHQQQQKTGPLLFLAVSMSHENRYQFLESCNYSELLVEHSYDIKRKKERSQAETVYIISLDLYAL